MSFILIDAGCSVRTMLFLSAVQHQVDITGSAPLASGFVFGVHAVTGMAALIVAGLLIPRMCAMGWVAAAVGSAGLAAHQIVDLRLSLLNMMIIVPVATALLFTILCHQLWQVRAARWLIAAGIVLFLSNPVTEHAKLSLLSQGDNYVYVAGDQSYRFTQDAWLRFWIVDHVQEASEVGGMICVLTLTLLKVSSLSTVRPARAAATSQSPEVRVRQSRT